MTKRCRTARGPEVRRASDRQRTMFSTIAGQAAGERLARDCQRRGGGWHLHASGCLYSEQCVSAGAERPSQSLALVDMLIRPPESVVCSSGSSRDRAASGSGLGYQSARTNRMPCLRRPTVVPTCIIEAYADCLSIGAITKGASR